MLTPLSPVPWLSELSEGARAFAEKLIAAHSFNTQLTMLGHIGPDIVIARQELFPDQAPTLMPRMFTQLVLCHCYGQEASVPFYPAHGCRIEEARVEQVEDKLLVHIRLGGGIEDEQHTFEFQVPREETND